MRTAFAYFAGYVLAIAFIAGVLWGWERVRWIIEACRTFREAEKFSARAIANYNAVEQAEKARGVHRELCPFCGCGTVAIVAEHV